MAKKPKRIKLKKIRLAPDTILHVAVPKGVVPIVAAHPDKIEIAPAPVVVVKEMGWWEYLFGVEKKDPSHGF